MGAETEVHLRDASAFHCAQAQNIASEGSRYKDEPRRAVRLPLWLPLSFWRLSRQQNNSVYWPTHAFIHTNKSLKWLTENQCLPFSRPMFWVICPLPPRNCKVRPTISLYSAEWQVSRLTVDCSWQCLLFQLWWRTENAHVNPASFTLNWNETKI